jgi:hypothetical protein
VFIGKEECGDLAAKEEVSKKKERENEKHTSGVQVHHFLPDPPNATSYGVPEVTVGQGGWRQTRKCERWHDSEVAVKKTVMKHG